MKANHCFKVMLNKHVDVTLIKALTVFPCWLLVHVPLPLRRKTKRWMALGRQPAKREVWSA